MDEAAERQARIDYLRSITPPPKKKPLWLKALFIVCSVALLAGAIVVTYAQLADKNPTKPQSATAQNDASKDTATAQEDTAEVATKRYDSPTLNLGFDYPETWKVVESSSTLTATSPATTLKNAQGKNMTGRIVMTINPKGQNLAPFDAGNATAVLTSEKLKYTKPSEVQRGETYMSFVQYANTTVMGALDALYITGDFGYQKGQAVPKVDVSNLDPVISVAFQQCADKTCSAPKAAPVAADMWNSKTFAEPIKKMITSLTVQ